MFCCFGQKRRRQAEEESTLVDFPAAMRKLTIDHGRVVTAPPSPGLTSIRHKSKWPTSVYSTTSTKRDSQATMPEKEVEIQVPRPTTTGSSVAPGPPSPTFSSFSFTPSVMSVRSNRSNRYETGSTRRTSIKKPNLETMAEAPWSDDGVSAFSVPASSIADGETVFSEVGPMPSENNLHPPLPAARSAFSSLQDPGRKASLDAISVAASGAERTLNVPVRAESSNRPRKAMIRAKSVPESEYDQLKTLSSFASGQSRSDPSSRKTSVGLQADNDISVTSSRKDKGRKHRPPPISTSRSSPTVPTVYIKAAGSSGSSDDATHSFRDKALPASPPKTPEPEEPEGKAARHSMFSVTSSQYSPTPSIHPYNQAQVMQAKQIQQISARPHGTRLPPTTGTRLANIAAGSPPTSASPKVLFPPNYSMASPSKHVNVSIAGVVAGFPTTPESSDGPTEEAFITAPTSAASPKSTRVASPEFPLTSASLSFPPNLPDYSFSPTKEAAPGHHSSRSGSQASELSSLPEVVPGQILPGDDSIPVHEMAASGENTIKMTGSGHGVAVSLKDVGLRGTATVTIGELAGMADLEKTRQHMAAA